MAGANEIGISTDRIFETLQKFAEPGMYGTIELEISLLPTAGDAIKITAIYDHDARPVSGVPLRFDPESNDFKAAKTERIHVLRSLICEQSTRLRVICPAVKLKATFQDGKCVSLRVMEREELSIGSR